MEERERLEDAADEIQMEIGFGAVLPTLISDAARG